MNNQNKNTILTVGAVVALAITVTLVMRQQTSGPPGASNQVYFYDLATGELFPAPMAGAPPIDAPSGAGQGVKALVAGCGSCDDADLRVVRLETMTDQAAAALAAMKSNPGPPSDALIAGQLVALPPASPGDPPAWVSQDSSQGRAILARTPGSACDGGSASICSP